MQLRLFEPEAPPLKNFRWIVVNSSGGKDSQTALRQVVQICDQQQVSRERIHVSHQDLGEAEWPGTRQAACYGLPVTVTRYRTQKGEELTLLDNVQKRGKWPSSQQRYCTSDFKRGPGSRVITQLGKQAAGSVLNVYGFRAEESPARAKKHVLIQNSRLSTRNRAVWDWCPILEWSEEEVWEDIRTSNVPYHPAYDLGMSRLSCRFCIFASLKDLQIAAKANPELFAEYVSVEKKIGHTFQPGRSLAAIAETL